MNVLEARAVLFSCLEGGAEYWTREIDVHCPVEVVEKLRGGGYDMIRFETTISRVQATDPSSVLSSITSSGSQFLTPEDPRWPANLDDLSTVPIGLVVKGCVDALQIPSLAIVGTRNPTNYGVRIAGDFAAGFVDREWAIVSGGAYGIDAAAHRGALVAEGVTVVVLAAGIDVNYPAGHANLFAEIAETGALVSEVMPGVRAIPARFLTRNRLIAALSRATLVVEAAFRS
jgi:DNA processing protein